MMHYYRSQTTFFSSFYFHPAQCSSETMIVLNHYNIINGTQSNNTVPVSRKLDNECICLKTHYIIRKAFVLQCNDSTIFTFAQFFWALLIWPGSRNLRMRELPLGKPSIKKKRNFVNKIHKTYFFSSKA